MPKILILSDLNWSPVSRDITEIEIMSLREKQVIPQDPKFNRLKDYAELILQVEPEMVLFAGDITGDGSCGHGYQVAFLYLLHMLDMLKIPTLFIQGDHDEEQYITYLEEQIKDLNFIHHISGKGVEVLGMTVLGLSYFHTNDKIGLKELVKNAARKVDIILCHSELKRRTWLFNFEADHIITGHYDHKCTYVDQKHFISCGNDFTFINYAIINKNEKSTVTSYGLKSFNNSFHIRMNATVDEDQYVFDQPDILIEGNAYKEDIIAQKLALKALFLEHQINLESIKGIEFKLAVETVLKLKKALAAQQLTWNTDMMNSLTKLKVSEKQKISRTFIKDYLEELVIKTRS